MYVSNRISHRHCLLRETPCFMHEVHFDSEKRVIPKGINSSFVSFSRKNDGVQAVLDGK